MVFQKDFDRAFGAIVNAPFEDAKRDFAIDLKHSSLDEQIKVASSKKVSTRDEKSAPSRSEITI